MKKCIIVVDYQNDFVSGALGFPGAEKLESVIVEKLKTYIKDGHDIIFTLDTHMSDYLETQEGKRLPIVHCIDNSFGHNVYGRVNDYLKHAKKVFRKSTYGSLELGDFLSKQAYDEIEVVGLVTNICVISNVIIAKAALPEARIVVDMNACNSYNESLHQQTLNILEGMHIDII